MTFLMLAVSVLVFPSPFITQYMIDTVIPSKSMISLIITLALYGTLIVLHGITEYYESTVTLATNESVFLGIKLDLLQEITNTNSRILETKSPAYIASRIDDEVGKISGLFAGTTFNIIRDLFTFSFGLIALFRISFELSLLIIVATPTFTLLSKYLSRNISKASSQFLEANALCRSQLIESISGIHLWKVHKKTFGFDSYKKAATIRKDKILNLNKIQTTHNALTGSIQQLLPVLVIGLGIWEIFLDKLSLGSLIAFNQFVAYVYGPTSRFINLHIEAKMAFSALSRIEELLKWKKDPPPLKLETIHQLSLEHICFSYDTTQESQNILNRINLTANKGEAIAIIGKSGSGKTTLLKILAGLYPARGRIIINKNYELQNNETLLGHTSYIPQESFVFRGSIHQNISLGEDNLNKEAFKFHDLLDFINQDIPGQESFANDLSQGQKQRIGIARGLSHNQSIIAFDEATANLDSENELKFLKLIAEFKTNHIVFFATHRLNVLDSFDRILVMDEGVIVEQGNLNYLLKHGPVFQKLHSDFFFEASCKEDSSSAAPA